MAHALWTAKSPVLLYTIYVYKCVVRTTAYVIICVICIASLMTAETGNRNEGAKEDVEVEKKLSLAGFLNVYIIPIWKSHMWDNVGYMDIELSSSRKKTYLYGVWDSKYVYNNAAVVLKWTAISVYALTFYANTRGYHRKWLHWHCETLRDGTLICFVIVCEQTNK